MSKKDTDINDNGTLTITYREDDGEVDRRRLAGIMGAATTAMMVLVIVTLSMGMVGAALGVGLGGFVANFDKVETNNSASIYPVLGSQGACANAPQLQAALNGDVQIYSNSSSTPAVEFFKDMPLPDAFFSANSFARVTIAGNGTTDTPIQASNLDLRLTALEAGELALGDQARGATIGSDAKNVSIAEMYTNPSSAADVYAVNNSNATSANTGTPIAATTQLNESGFNDQTSFGISGEGFVVDQGSAAAHQVTFDGINLQDVQLAVQILNDTSSTNNSVINPDSLSPGDCSALSAHAQLDDQPYMGEGTDLTNASEAGIQLDSDTNVTRDEFSSPRGNE
jgi:hypothetical protein